MVTDSGINGKFLIKVSLSVYEVDFIPKCSFAALLDPSTVTETPLIIVNLPYILTCDFLYR